VSEQTNYFLSHGVTDQAEVNDKVTRARQQAQYHGVQQFIPPAWLRSWRWLPPC
jgi:hypothetical protein